jgi:preprotein translocase subunit YajC
MMYLLMIRPQRKLKAQRAQLMAALSPGDEIVTIGGLYGRVDEVGESTVDIEIAEGVIVRFDRRAVATITKDIPADDVDEDEDEDDDEADEDAADHHDPDTDHHEDPEETTTVSTAVDDATGGDDPAAGTTR